MPHQTAVGTVLRRSNRRSHAGLLLRTTPGGRVAVVYIAVLLAPAFNMDLAGDATVLYRRAARLYLQRARQIRH